MAGGWTDIFKPPRKEQNQLAAGIIRWRKFDDDRRNGPKQAPGNKLNEKERHRILEVANRPAYRDL
jgi:hypothetical protein